MLAIKSKILFSFTLNKYQFFYSIKSINYISYGTSEIIFYTVFTFIQTLFIDFTVYVVLA